MTTSRVPFPAVCLTVIAVSSGALADPISPSEVPPPLREWTAWVLHGNEDARCPFLGATDAGRRTCTWPARLELALEERGGRFSQRFLVHRKGWARLPGNERRWPQAVKVDGKPAVVLEREGAPHVALEPGEHVVTGEFSWDSLPESLQVPNETGLLALTVKGKAMNVPTRDASGAVFLQKEATTDETENLDVRVHRLISDDIPLQVTTHIRLDVSGKGREVLLGTTLLDGFIPMALTSALPARVEPDGRVRVQVRAGKWELRLTARREGAVVKLARPEPNGPWTTEDEIWVFDARPSLRQVLVEGVPAVDPKQTTLPEDWKGYPAYRVKVGDELSLSERRRGDADPPPDMLTLHRELWLDFDGGGMTASDQISGALTRSWRLEVKEPTKVGRVVVGETDQFITRLDDQHAPGVELRQGNVAMRAESRIEGSPWRIPAVSWDADFNRVSANLRLPPGWTLFHATGADDVPTTWLKSWSLLDLFLLMIIAFATGKLFGRAWGALALVTLGLVFPEHDAPKWIWLFVLAGEALVRLLPLGWMRRAAWAFRLGTWAILAIMVVPFLRDQVRRGLYPAMELPNLQVGSFTASYAVEGTMRDPASASDAFEPPPEMPAEPARKSAGSSFGSAANALGNKDDGYQRKLRSYNVQDYDRNATVQTGPGLPRWNWRTVRLSWSGPVERTQQLGLWLIPPWANTVLAFLRAALLALLVLVVFGLRSRALRFFSRFGPPRASAAAGVALFVALGASNSALAQGDAAVEPPTPAILEELRSRLLAPPSCLPRCAAISKLKLEVTPRRLKGTLDVGAAANTAIPLPGSAQQWSPEAVTVDGRAASGLLRTEDGQLWLQVAPGSHVVVFEGALPGRDTVQLSLPLKPHRVEVSAQGWTIDGVYEDGLADEDLQLSRAGSSSDEGVTVQPANLPPYVIVHRSLALGLDWELETKVRRLTPTGSAIVLEIPLLAGESVTSLDTRVQNGRVLVNMGPNVSEFTWSSVLAVKPSIQLTAPTGVPWSEIWKLEVSPVWHVGFSGIPMVHSADASGDRLPEWRPWPGESVKIDVVRPAGIEGQTVTIDQSALDVTPGVRASDATLTLTLRSSRGGQWPITLPEGATLQSVRIAGVTQPIRQEGRKVNLPLVPGAQIVQLTWREPVGMSMLYRTPEVDLGGPAVNAQLKVTMPRDRWMLFLGGPRLGPSVHFWSLLVVLLAISAALGHVKLTPLRTLQWALLTIGLSQVAVEAAAVAAAWFLAVGWRERNAELSRPWLFNLRQVALFGWGLVSLGILFAAIHEGLLGSPDMQIQGNGSYGTSLTWFQDRIAGAYPRAWVLSVPLLVYRLAMLGWALWLARAMLEWMRWAWGALNAGGLWRRSPPKPATTFSGPVPPPGGPSSAVPPPAP